MKTPFGSTAAKAITNNHGAVTKINLRKVFDRGVKKHSQQTKANQKGIEPNTTNDAIMKMESKICMFIVPDTASDDESQWPKTNRAFTTYAAITSNQSNGAIDNTLTIFLTVRL